MREEYSVGKADLLDCFNTTLSGGWTRSEEHHGRSNWPITSPYSFTSVLGRIFMQIIASSY